MRISELDDNEKEILTGLHAQGFGVVPDGSAVIVVGPREKIPVDRPTDAADLMSATRARRFESLRAAQAVLSPEISQ